MKGMKRGRIVIITTAVLAIALLAGCGVSQAGTQSSSEAMAHYGDPMEANRAALGVREQHHLDVAVLTAHQVLAGEQGYRADHFAIVACGPAVERLAEDEEIAENIGDLPEDTVDISACGLTVERFDIDPDEFPPGVDVVPNGLVELMRLEAEGYESVEL